MSKPAVASKLPYDIINIIIRLACPDPIIRRNTRWNESDIVQLARVCRSWRYALLSNPVIWTNVEAPLANPWALEEVLRRSADQPLQIALSLEFRTADYIARNLEIILRHLSRIQTLLFQHLPTTPDLSYIFQMMDNKPAPRLKVLTFDLYTGSCWGTFNHILDRGRVPENLFANGLAPNLEELNVLCLSVSHAMPLFKTITRLHLTHSYGIHSISPLFDLLEATAPHIQVLHLDFTKTVRIFEVRELDDRSIEFLALKSLSLKITPEAVVAILGHTTMPSDIHYNIDCGDALLKPALNCTPLFSFLSKTQTGKCVLFRIDNYALDIEFSKEEDLPPNASLKMKVGDEQACLERIDRLFLSLHGFRKVSFCDILSPYHCKSSPRKLPDWLYKYQHAFSSLFSFFEKLEKLVIACEDTHTLYLLMLELEPKDRAGEVFLPCPLLSDLTVGLINLTGGTLINILKSRKEAGGMLTSLCVECDSSQDDVRKRKSELEELAANFELFAVSSRRQDNMSFISSVSGGRLIEKAMNSWSSIPYTKRDKDITRRSRL